MEVTSIPTGARWSIMDQLSFPDLVNFCQAGKTTKCTITYFIRRLQNLCLDRTRCPPIDWFYLNRDLPPIDRYVAVLAYSDLLDLEPGALNYILTSDIIFPGFVDERGISHHGVEFFIGLFNSINRAVGRLAPPDLNFIDYILHLYPINLKSIAIDLDRYGILPLYLQSFLPKEGYVSTFGYQPITNIEASTYSLGLLGADVDPPYLVYLYGLIGRQHEAMFRRKYTEFMNIENKGLLADVYIHSYIVSRGSLQMINFVIESGRVDSMIHGVIVENNISAIKVLLEKYLNDVRRVVVTNPGIHPGSVEMVDLLSKYGIYFPPEKILAKALWTSNYALFLKSGVPRLTHLYSLSGTTGFLLREYFRKYPNKTDMQTVFQEANRIGNIYAMEILLELGVEIEIVDWSKLVNLDVVKVMGWDLTPFPKLASLMKMS